MKDSRFIEEAINDIDGMAKYAPEKAAQYADEELRLMYQYMNRLFALVSRYREWVSAKPSGTRDRHVGDSDYSEKEIQPWDMWLSYALNPWDADIQKRLIRTKTVPGKTAAESRIEDYEKMKHICDERIDQIKAGDPFYGNLAIPPWVQDAHLDYGQAVDLEHLQEEIRRLKKKVGEASAS